MAATPPAPGAGVLAVISLSDSFGEFWSLLATELGIALVSLAADDPALPADPIAVVIAAGGAESEVGALIDRLGARKDAPLLVAGASLSHRVAAQVLAAGASDYFALPDDRDAMRGALRAALERHRAAHDRATLATLEGQAHAFREIVGTSPALRATLERAARTLAFADATVLITGETGTGKELLARALHYGGRRATAPFVELNCAALPATLLESELFGHERGAFTDAKTAKPGLFEVAQGGTLFLDEIDSLAVELQSKLLRALDQKEVRRLGATASRVIDVRIIAATNANLTRAVQARQFREDLFYRLNVVTLELPPLRARGDDVLLLAAHFVRRFSTQYGIPEPALSAETRRALQTHPWPGNIRELRNVVERTLLLSPSGEFRLEGLTAMTAPASAGSDLPFPTTLAELQRAAAQAMLELTGGNRSEAARRLDVSRSRLQRLLRGSGDDLQGEEDSP
ncbi:MAG TPA: sigma-54 dependent transcriptional regulator [Gemmatimonadales bacterium]|nr:sigma-54 dependent transcriptional regulator [Gemmatimonadales bacterium]